MLSNNSKKGVTPECTFSMNVPTEAKNLAKFVEKIGIRKSLANIFIDVDRQKLVASNGKILQSVDIEISDLQTNSEKPYCYIDPKDIKNLTGECRVAGNSKKTVIVNERGEAYGCCCSEIFPPYASLLLKKRINTRGRLCFGKDGIKKLITFVKLTAKYGEIYLEVHSNSREALITSVFAAAPEGREEIKIKLKQKALCDARVCFETGNFYDVIRSAWNGTVWLSKFDLAQYFDSKNAEVTLLMPYSTDEECFTPFDGRTGDIWLDERNLNSNE